MRQLPPLGTTDRDRDFAIRQLIDGRGNGTGTVTLDTGTTTTTVTRTNANENAAVVMFPATATAAADVATTYISAVTRSGFEITHTSSAVTDRTFYYVVVGG